jgi:hypothetical protein
MKLPTIITLCSLLGVVRLAGAGEPAAGAPRALVIHVAPSSSPIGAAIEIEAMIDAPFAETLTVRWRAIGGAAWQDEPFERSSAGGWFARLPAPEPPGLEYYIRGTDQAGAELDHFASERAPHAVRVEPGLYDRLETLDRARLRDRRNEVALDVIAHDFGNRYGIRDAFIRGELVYTHRVWRILHEVGFGFGSITGWTPAMSVPGGDDVLRGARYGFGQVRLRAHPSVFLDGRLGLGVTHFGFEPLVRGAITFGKPWRSCVTAGAEHIGDLGPTAWVRLQWDTAPPLLMGASIVRTDLPGATIDRVGLFIAYDVSYEVAARFKVRAQVSYGSRDGPARFGGGLGTAVDF